LQIADAIHATPPPAQEKILDAHLEDFAGALTFWEVENLTGYVTLLKDKQFYCLNQSHERRPTTETKAGELPCFTRTGPKIWCEKYRTCSIA
jgi:hypothetical protein